jgi:hypothetical protein
MKGHAKYIDNGDTFPRPLSPPPSPPTKGPVIHQMIKSYKPKTKSSYANMFLKVLKNKPEPAPTSGKKSSGVQVLKKVPAEKIVTHASF